MMNKLKHMQNNPDFLDSEEQNMIENLNAAIDAGAFVPSQEKEIVKKKSALETSGQKYRTTQSNNFTLTGSRY
ncbi:MAG TPA: hypothetical protein ENK06_02325 [Gammaproteobacteria bacterium]|nr:hypothetical protein [Gammaproteobacteria bacterium]